MTQESLNPFSSHFVSPSACRFILPDQLEDSNGPESQVISNLCDQVLQNKTSQIVGPHGCGKSTLATKIAVDCNNRFSTVHSVILRSRSMTATTPEVQWNLDQPFSPLDFSDGNFVDKRLNNRLVVVDGLESLPSIHGRLFLQQLKTINCSTMVTTHKRQIGIPVLAKIKPDQGHFLKIVDQLQCHRTTKIPPNLLKIVFDQSNGNYRDAIWELYDHWELMNNYQDKTSKDKAIVSASNTK